MTWLPFDLHPEYPQEGILRAQLTAHYGEEGRQRIQHVFEGAGLTYNPHAEVVPNSMRALRVTELARERGLHEEVHDRLMAAYWDEGRNIGDPEELLELATEAGLDSVEVEGVLGGGAYLDRVRSSTAEAQSVGVTGVPAFVLDGRLLVLGAQPQEVFEAAFERLGVE